MAGWAPQYSTGERVRLLLFHAAWALPVFLLTQFVFFPWFDRYLETAHCQQYGSLNGLELVFFGMFVGLPLGLALIVLALEGRRSYCTLMLGQSPLPGEKVFRPTRYVHGLRARLRPLLFFLVVLFLVAVSVWGYFQAASLMRELSPDWQQCLMHTTPLR